jgi:chorismate synthase
MTEEGIRTLSNHSGGIQGGISNGETISLRVGFKPPSSIFKKQDSVTSDGLNVVFELKRGRHDACVLPRAVPIVEAMVLLVLVDHFLRQKLVR